MKSSDISPLNIPTLLQNVFPFPPLPHPSILWRQGNPPIKDQLIYLCSGSQPLLASLGTLIHQSRPSPVKSFPKVYIKFHVAAPQFSYLSCFPSYPHLNTQSILIISILSPITHFSIYSTLAIPLQLFSHRWEVQQKFLNFPLTILSLASGPPCRNSPPCLL